MILDKLRIIIRDFAGDVSISLDSCQAIFIDFLSLKRGAATFSPILLYFHQKQSRNDIAQKMLFRFAQKGRHFKCHYIFHVISHHFRAQQNTTQLFISRSSFVNLQLKGSSRRNVFHISFYSQALRLISQQQQVQLKFKVVCKLQIFEALF